MMVTTAAFACSICSEPSSEICVFCTKDACANHRCDRCKRCSDCCECEVPLSAAIVAEPLAATEPALEPAPLAPGPEPLVPAAEVEPEPAEETEDQEPPEEPDYSDIFRPEDDELPNQPPKWGDLDPDKFH